MRSRYIPATQETAKQSYEYIIEKIVELQAATATRKRLSLRDKLLQERLQGLLVMHYQFENEMYNLDNLLDPKLFDKEVRKKIKVLAEIKQSHLAKRVAIAELN